MSLDATTVPSAGGGLDRVHVVYKTHLDVGFTDTAANVLRRYRDDYIPEAIRLAAALRDEFGEPRFVWTTGAWLLKHALECSTPENRERLHHAISDGLVAWHALPFSVASETLRRPLLDDALRFSKELDRAYGRQTTAGKMTDVPGHTIGLVAPLADGGVRYLHIGVNPATPVPETPQHYVWRDADGHEVVVSVDANYGSDPDSLDVLRMPNCRDGLFLAFTNDNVGPPTRSAVLDLLAALGERYPDAEIVPSTLDAFGRAAWAARAGLPVVTQEVGDSWIYGIAADPLLTSRLSRLQRAREQWIEERRLEAGSAPDLVLTEGLLLAGEHTWGYDRKTYLPDYLSYEKPEFVRARERDVVDVEERIPSALAYAKAFPPHALGPLTYSGALHSWDEKRARTAEAVAALPEPLLAEVTELLQVSAPELPAHATPHPVGSAVVMFDGVTLGVTPNGALHTLRVGQAELTQPDRPFGELSYWLYGADDMQRWQRDYIRSKATTADWALADLGKIGLELSPRFQTTRVMRPAVSEIWSWEDGHERTVRIVMEFPGEATEEFGAPRSVVFDYRVATTDQCATTVVLNAYLSGKDALLAPEATWLRLNPAVRSPHRWRVDKSGTLVDPHDVVRSGGRNWHAIQAARYEDAFQSLTIEPIDAPLCSVGRPRMFEWDNEVAPIDDGLAFCLHNNCWGTNYRQWYDEPARYEFRISLTTSDSPADAARGAR